MVCCFRKSVYDMRSAHPGNQEQVIIENPLKGRYVINCNIHKETPTLMFSTRYYIVLYGYEDYRDIGFEAEYR